uniref:Uncharacterized protein n=1 Tax=Magallana gigas TaxID=29159 RepID=K1RPG2_MAGGI
MFRPVIKQIKNIDGNTTVQPTNNTRGLPFLCRVKTDSKKPVPCINTSQTDNNNNVGIFAGYFGKCEMEPELTLCI